jgi:hypothetical protein
MSSDGFITHTQKLRNICKQRNIQAPENLIFEAMWRVGTPDGLTRYAAQLGPEGVLRGLLFIKEMDRKDRHLVHNSVAKLCDAALSCSDYVKRCASIVDNWFTANNPHPSQQEIEQQLAVADIMLS